MGKEVVHAERCMQEEPDHAGRGKNASAGVGFPRHSDQSTSGMNWRNILKYTVFLGVGVLLFSLAFSLVEDKEALW